MKWWLSEAVCRVVAFLPLDRKSIKPYAQAFYPVWMEQPRRYSVPVDDRHVPVGHGVPRRGSANACAIGVEKVTDTVDLSAVKVMVIDDSNTIRRSAEIFLSQMGCQVILAEDGFDALAKISDHQPDIIFCDILMPRLDGYQTCALIKKNAHFADTPVVMLSSKDGLFDRARGRMVGSDQYLTKPFTREALIKAVGDHVSAGS